MEPTQLTEAAAGPDPIRFFARWFDEAAETGAPLPEAMTLATATPDGRPSARMVLLKGFGPEGFVFFTNFDSRKAAELAANPRAALSFHWPALERQVRIEGSVSRTADSEADDYFDTRPRGSRIGAWASPQSRVIESRTELEAEVRRRTEEFGAGDIPRPPFWGGFRVAPERIEFWQGQRDRLHDRLVYARAAGADGADKGWDVSRLAP
ncbi:MAG: pyridoxamine 5'-phosphate oxidase [Gemmatimonadota bacterium]